MQLIVFFQPTTRNIQGEWGRGVKGDQGKMFLKVMLPGVIWGISEERNRRIFEDKERCMWAVIDSIVCEISSWVLVKKEISNFSLNDIVRDWVTCIKDLNVAQKVPPFSWNPPDVGTFKINFDGASCGNPGLFGFGCV